ncbi:sodium- and chloride-dependent glycine transporter 2-like [Maniola hyperantus]|uniref:sodium- and chloride-dependent glycine transporter 2-like n=1 Tax=Aphantopus hyperantus TaxID=2795564 RepID=UPI001567F104|nr:sodium- and chloride-dependent glycine transporter 2-like [Maniola hyperantus]
MIPEESNLWGSRIVYISVLVCHLVGISNISSIPVNALKQGAVGYTLFLILFHILMGIPLQCMEAVVGQFTKRDCIAVWKIRPCFSYMGYVLVIWQVIVLIYNQIVTSFFLHYFLIGFENPIPFYTCGSWRTRYCNSLATNYTVNQDCLKYQNKFPYCNNLYKTFPEYQYWRYHLLKARGNREFHVAWRVSVASGLICFILYLSNFKRTKTLRWITVIFTIYSTLALMIIMMGSMTQKGVVVKYEESLDLDFSIFQQKFQFSHLIQEIVYNLNIGSGTMFTLASTLSFRSPSFSDIVISVVFYTVISVMFVFTTAMMTCPYAYEYGIKPGVIMRIPITLNFEKIPRLMYQYEHRTFYLIVIFSCEVVLGMSTLVIYLFNLLEVTFKRYPKLATYPGLTAFCAVLLLFFTTLPFLSYLGVNSIALSFRRCVVLLTTFIGLLEGLVFIIWYGVSKFSEDFHFMLGIQPKNFMKGTWILAIIILAYAFCNELYSQLINQTGYIYATYSLIAILSFIAAFFVIRLLIAACRKRFHKFISIDPTWGPRSEVLQRSRAMFSAQAMTKEYIYRQYHLQAGIMARQKMANRRV